MIGICADIFEVIMFAACADALLAVDGTTVIPAARTEKDIFKLIHTRVCEQKSIIAEGYHRRRRSKGMPLVLEKLYKRTSYFRRT
jgi:hypothetical protein